MSADPYGRLQRVLVKPQRTHVARNYGYVLGTAQSTTAVLTDTGQLIDPVFASVGFSADDRLLCAWIEEGHDLAIIGVVV